MGQRLCGVRCPAIETGESPFDEDGMLDLTMIEVRPDMQAFVRFQENAPKFWEKWMEGKREVGVEMIKSGIEYYFFRV